MTIRVTGAEVSDITFTSEVYGCFNVTRAIAWAKRYGIHTVSRMEEVRENLISILEDIDLDPARLDELRLVQGFEPILLVELPDGTPFIIDGHHRLKIALERDFTLIYGFLIPRPHVDQFRVRYYDGEREMTSIELLNAIQGKHTDTQGKPRET